MPNLRPALGALLGATATFAFAQDPQLIAPAPKQTPAKDVKEVKDEDPHLLPANRKSHYMGYWMGRSSILFGSNELRTVLGYDYGYGRPWKQASLPRHNDAQFVYEGYFHYTANNGERKEPISETYSLGFTAFGRWLSEGAFFDLGWGANYANKKTDDLPTMLTSTPFLGFGYRWHVAKKESLVGLRWFHLSNGGTNRRNNGQNQFLLYVQVRTF